MCKNKTTTQGWVELHGHSGRSLLDGFPSAEEIVISAKEKGLNGIALTDHGSMGNIFSFMSSCKEHGVKGIIGCEFYITPNRFRKKFTRLNPENVCHFLVLAKNAEGYRNMCLLTEEANKHIYRKNPRIDMPFLSDKTEGLMTTTGCMASVIHKALAKKDEEKAIKHLEELIGLFGKENVLVEIQRHPGIPKLEDSNQWLLEKAKKYNLRVVATNDFHYCDKKDAVHHDALLAINTGAKISDTMRFKFSDDSYYIHEPEEMMARFSDIPEAVNDTVEILAEFEEISLVRDMIMPHLSWPAPFTNEIDYLTHLATIGLREKYGTNNKAAVSRLEYELNVIDELGFAGYFLIIQDIIQIAKTEVGALVGPGRGSAAGSIVSYLLGITTIDPLKYGLLFERFLNPDRVSLPDIDTDFSHHLRGDLIRKIQEKYGSDYVAAIGTLGTMGPKMALKDVGRVQGYHPSFMQQISNMIPNKTKTIEDAVRKESGLWQVAAKNQELFRTAVALQERPRSFGAHPCGIFISNTPIKEHVPLKTTATSDLMVAEWDMNEIEKAGYIKLDLLGSKNMTIIQRALDLIERDTGKRIDLFNVDPDDPAFSKVYETLSEGHTTGVFQLSEQGMTNTVIKMNPKKFADLYALCALYRPGPMQYIETYIKRSRDNESFEYDHPLLEPILKETYGIYVYQEQIMRASQVLANFTGGQADILRKGIGKKKEDILFDMKPKFIQGCIDNNVDEAVAEKIWSDWIEFADYGFNKSHAVSYATITFWTAALSTFYPAAFYAACLSQAGDTDKIGKYLHAAKKRGVEVSSPDVILSEVDFSVKGNTIIFGLGGVKGLGLDAAQAIVDNRPYEDIYQFFLLNNLDKTQFLNLGYVGAYNSFGLYRSGIGNEKTIGALVNWKKQNKKGMTLFKPDIPGQKEVDPTFYLTKEYDILGFYVTFHPADQFSLKEGTVTPVMNINKDLRGSYLLLGAVETCDIRTSKKGNRYIVFKLSDSSGRIELFCFGKKVNDYIKLLSSIGTVVVVTITMRFSDFKKSFEPSIDKIQDIYVYKD